MALETDNPEKIDRDIVVLTGQPVSDELQAVLDRCEKGIEVPIEEVLNTPEMIAASSCVSHQTPTIQLKGREAIEEKVFNILNNYGSVKVDDKGDSIVDSHGNTVYNEDVEQGSRLDIVIGLPASGKSSAIVDKISYEHKAKLIDNDEAKRLFPEFNKGWGANTVHLESQMVEREVFKAAIRRHDNIVMPKVGSDADKLIKDYISLAKKEGYKVNVHYVDLDKNKTMGRMLRRFIHKGRYLSPRLIDKYVNEREGNKILEAYEALKAMGAADGFSKWNNDVGIGEKPILMESIGLSDKFIKEARVTSETIIDNGGREDGELNGEHSQDGQVKSDELHRREDGGENREAGGGNKQENSREGIGDRRNERDREVQTQHEDISRGGSRGAEEAVKTFRAYTENEKEVYDVTMFNKEGKPVFYIEDGNENPLMLGDGTMSDTFEFSAYNAKEFLNEYGVKSNDLDGFTITEVIDPERTEAELKRAMDVESLPVQLNVDISLDGEPAGTKYYAFSDERDAQHFIKNFRNELEDFSKTSGVEVIFDTKICERDDKKRGLKTMLDSYKESPIVRAFRDKTNEQFHELDGTNAESIEMMVKDQVQASLDEWGIDAVVLDAVLVGSRCRGLERENSDVDVVVEFYGNIAEDALYNELKSEWIGIDGHEVDINPITRDKSGSLDEYLPKAEAHLANKAEKLAKEQAMESKKAEVQAKEQAEREAEAKEKARIEEEQRKEEEARQAHSHEVASTSTFGNFKLDKNVDDEKYILIADVKNASGKITEGAAIAEFANKAAALAFCEKNGIEAEDITKHLQSHIEHKKHVASEKGRSDGHEDPSKSDRNRKNVGIDD